MGQESLFNVMKAYSIHDRLVTNSMMKMGVLGLEMGMEKLTLCNY